MCIGWWWPVGGCKGVLQPACGHTTVGLDTLLTSGEAGSGGRAYSGRVLVSPAWVNCLAHVIPRPP